MNKLKRTGRINNDCNSLLTKSITGEIFLTTGTCWCWDQSLPCWEPPCQNGTSWAETRPWRVFPRGILLLHLKTSVQQRQPLKHQVATNQTHARAMNPNNSSQTDFLLPFLELLEGHQLSVATCTNQNAKTRYNPVKRKQGLILSSTLDIFHSVSD